MPLQQTAVIFDLDGTLLNSLADIANAGNKVLRAHGYPPHPLEDYRWYVGDGVRRLMDRILPTACREDSAQLNGFIQEFVAEYQQAWNIESRLYAGVTELLDRLVERQIRLAVLSNKPQAATTRCVEHYLGHYEFAAILGQHAQRPPKPDLTGVREILASLQVAADSCCYVGDTGVDMQTARGAGLYAIGATWGFREAAELLEAGAQGLIDHPCDLLPLLGF